MGLPIRRFCLAFGFGLALATGGSAAGPGDPILLEWPPFPARAWIHAWMGTSLRAPLARESRPMLEELVGGPPFVRDGDRVALDPSGLPPGVATRFEAAATGTPPRIAEVVYREVASTAYHELDRWPGRRADLERELGMVPGGVPWDSVTVESAIVRGARRIRYRPDLALDAWLAGPAGSYPPGTAFFSEEVAPGGEVLETHGMRKRVDRLWDFAIYDGQGRRVEKSPHHPQRFRVPTSCLACHAGSRRVTPFEEFPEPADPVGSFLPRVDEAVSAEERARLAPLLGWDPPGDEVLGRYGLVAAVRLMRAAATRPLAAWEAERWVRLEPLLTGPRRPTPGSPSRPR